jgi:hypothetical protein
MAGLLATDPFDALFIARYLKDACPDVRLFTMDSDLLWVRASQDFPFEGTLAVTTYPLIEANQGWTNVRPFRGEVPLRKLFPSRASEGIYNAVRALLLSPQEPSSSAAHTSGKEPLQGQFAEYSDPFGQCHDRSEHRPECQSPPVWITVVSRDGYWPLAVQHVVPNSDSPFDALAAPHERHASLGWRAPAPVAILVDGVVLLHLHLCFAHQAWT